MRNSHIAALAGLVPVLVANAAFLININTGNINTGNIDVGLDGCFPYWEGCYSVSRGIRSGHGLWLFKAFAIPTALLMAWCWQRTSIWVGFTLGSRERWIAGLGVAGAAFFLVYSMWLGTEGDIYRWMRRYGVVFYFAFTALAQLLLASKLWNQRHAALNGALRRQVGAYFGTVVLMWGLGVASAFKRKLIDDPAFLDRVENALEWNFALAMSLVFVALALVHRAAEKYVERGNGEDQVAQ